MHRIAKRLAGDYLVTAKAFDDDGDAVQLSRVISAAVVDGAGETVTVEASPELHSNELSLEIAFDELPFLDAYTVTWVTPEGTWTTPFELVGGFLCEIADIRAQPDLSDKTRYPTDVLRKVRADAETDIEDCAMGAYVHRGCREAILTNDGYFGSPNQLLVRNCDLHSRTVYSAAINGVALTETELAQLRVFEQGVIERPDGWPTDSIVDIHYEHGDANVPPQIVSGCARHARRFLLVSQLGGRASMESSELGSVRLTFATRVGETGDMDLDAAIKRTGHVRSLIRQMVP